MNLYKNLAKAVEDRDQVEALKLNLQGETLPPKLFSFSNLKELYLEGNITQIPRLGTPWPHLRVLSIKFPHFTGSLAQLFSLPKLENLKIIQTPQKNLLLPLGFCTSPLKFLTIKDCGLETLPEEISMLTEMTEMQLPQNHLSSLPHSFSALSKLRRLNLDGNKFELFPEVIGGMPHLAHLSIDGNLFTDEEKARIQREFHLTVV